MVVCQQLNLLFVSLQEPFLYKLESERPKASPNMSCLPHASVRVRDHSYLYPSHPFMPALVCLPHASEPFTCQFAKSIRLDQVLLGSNAILRASTLTKSDLYHVDLCHLYHINGHDFTALMNGHKHVMTSSSATNSLLLRIRMVVISQSQGPL